MTEEDGALINEVSSNQQVKQVNVSIQQGEHTNELLYSNFTTLHGMQGAILVDFGFLDPNTLNNLNRMIKLGEKSSEPITAKLSCRMAISTEAAHNLSQQLNQLLNIKIPTSELKTQEVKNTTDVIENESEAHTDSGKQSASKGDKGGFRFPWSK